MKFWNLIICSYLRWLCLVALSLRFLKKGTGKAWSPWEFSIAQFSWFLTLQQQTDSSDVSTRPPEGPTGFWWGRYFFGAIRNLTAGWSLPNERKFLNINDWLIRSGVSWKISFWSRSSYYEITCDFSNLYSHKTVYTRWFKPWPVYPLVGGH